MFIREDFSNSAHSHRGMRRVLLALCFVASMLLAGCTGPSSAAWGQGSDAVEVSFSMDGTDVKSELSGKSTTTSGLIPVGCLPGTEGGELSPGNGSAISFTGYLAASHFYNSHDELNGARGLDFGVTTAVAIQSMPFSQAAGIENGDGPRVDVKMWPQPLSPDTGAGSVNIANPDSIEKHGSDWFVLGLIPTSENVLDGMKVLDEWHQAVSIKGYLVSTEGTTPGYLSSWHKANNECAMRVGDTNPEGVYVLVTEIVLDGATVSSNGEADDEWVHGDVPILGRNAFIMFFLVGGIGGAVGLFIVSKARVLSSAKKDMANLVGAEGMKKAASVKSDAKAAKEAGMLSPTERSSKADKERKAQSKKEKSPPVKTESKKKRDDNPMGGFDLDSVLASTSTSTGPGGSGPGGRKSSVVATEAAQNMEAMNKQEVPASSSLPSSMTQRRSSPPPSTVQSSRGAPPEPEPTAKKPPVRRRKAVKKASPVVEEPAPQNYEEEEDFSDFSF